MSPPNTSETLRWVGDAEGYLVLIDQARLPMELVELECRDAQTVWEAIRELKVRGAPAIGLAAAYGVCLGLQSMRDRDAAAFHARLQDVTDFLASSRPTAVNLFWALERMKTVVDRHRHERSAARLHDALFTEARFLHDEDRATCHAIGRHGADRLPDGAGVLTHCNAGGLAASEYGTALSVLFTAQDQGKRLHVFVDETRPLLQGARLTAWELVRRRLPATLICDSMAAQVMREGRVQVVITGADRIAANGDTANKIGTYSVAVLAHAHQIPFYVAAPCSTFDLSLAGGDGIPIEQRAPEEITHGFGRQTAPDGIQVYNPAFDVTPARYITGIITERGVIAPVTADNVARLVADRQAP
ncbi:MAG: S-methyl-5-thioribose-1-phosphate isomerase [Candidatus Anammoximicrobium sp.]|nr:S-methyl-5-thioribose-1-phosphate isomerase [Candidatus Anammoximicrobium sp.]